MRTIVTAARASIESQLGAAPEAPEREIHRPFVLVEDGRILSVGSLDSTTGLPPGEHHDFPGATLVAAYFDVHVHGCRGRDVMEGTPESVAVVGRFLAEHGVAAYLPTTITAPHETTLRCLAALARRIAEPTPPGTAIPLGIHIEGPFLSPKRKGAHPQHDLRPPTVAFFDEMWQASEGTLRLMTLAPELPGALEVIARARELGVRVSLGHSDATYAQAAEALALGANSATHTFNAMRPFEQREPGLLGLALTDPYLYAELICDGLHVHPAAVRLFWASKGADRAILVTDAMAATGMPDGTYRLGELLVRLEAGRCLIGENTLAGSTLTLDRGVRNFAQFTGCGVAAAARLASRSPAHMAGFADTLGTLAVGRSADLLALSPEGELLAAWIGGKQVDIR